MSKKLIAAMVAFTTLFVCVFAACNDKDNDDDKPKDTRPYIDSDEYEFVTDENGEKVLDEYGEFIVYVTEENGDIVTDENGENVTKSQLFQAFKDGDTFEDYGYKIKLPKGWSASETQGVFVNKSKSQEVEISVINKTYADYYISSYEIYAAIEKMVEEKNEAVAELKDVTWEEKVEIGEGFNDVVRFSLIYDEQVILIYIFENAGNTYKAYFTAKDGTTAVEDSLAICKAMSFKPYQYYEELQETTTLD